MALHSTACPPLVAAGLALGLATAHPGSAQRRSPDFPTWEGEFDSSVPDPLPRAARGEFRMVFALDVDGLPTGLAVTAQDLVAAPTLDGHLALLALDGAEVSRLELGGSPQGAPVTLGSDVLVRVAERLVRAGPEGIVWTADLDAAAVLAPAVSRDGIALAVGGGRVEHRHPATGELLWAAEAGAEVTAGPARAGAMEAWGTAAGEILALDRDSGRELWRLAVGDGVDALVAAPEGVYFASSGRTGRTGRGTTGPFLGRIRTQDQGRRADSVRWRLRVGGASVMPPLLGPGHVLFASHDGYVRALDRRSGALQWRTDLPSRVRHAPARAGGRLDFALPLTGLLVALSAENGAVMGWTSLEDEDESFVGPAATAGGTTLVATNFGRVLGFRWEADAPDPGGS